MADLTKSNDPSANVPSGSTSKSKVLQFDKKWYFVLVGVVATFGLGAGAFALINSGSDGSEVLSASELAGAPASENQATNTPAPNLDLTGTLTTLTDPDAESDSDSESLSADSTTTTEANKTTTTAAADKTSTSAASSTTAKKTTTTAARTTSTRRRETTSTTRGRTTTTTTRPTNRVTFTRPTPTTDRPATTGRRTTRTTRPVNNGSECGGDPRFSKIFRDDFNGTTLDSSWTPFDSIGNAGFGLRRPHTIKVRDGQLVITAGMEGSSLVSGGMNHSKGQVYGRYEFVASSEINPALSSVVLTWPQNLADKHNNDRGENNMYETLANNNGDEFYGFVHKPTTRKIDGKTIQAHFVYDADPRVPQKMVMEWTPEGIKYFRNGKRVMEKYDDSAYDADYIPHTPHHAAIQLDAKAHSMSGTSRLKVDYMEICKYNG